MNVEQLIKDFSKEKNVTIINADSFSVSIPKFFDIASTKNVKIYNFDGCAQSVKDKLNREIASLNDKVYEVVITENTEKSHLKFLINWKTGELIMLQMGKTPGIIHAKGDLSFLHSKVKVTFSSTENSKEENK